MCAASFEEVVGAVDVGCVVKFGIRNRRSYAGTGSEVDDLIEFVLIKGFFDEGFVSDVALDDLNMIAYFGDVMSFDGWIVVVVKVVEDGYFMPLLDEVLSQMGSDESGTSGN